MHSPIKITRAPNVSIEFASKPPIQPAEFIRKARVYPLISPKYEELTRVNSRPGEGAPDSFGGGIAPSARIVRLGEFCRRRINQGESHIKAQVGRAILILVEELALANAHQNNSCPRYKYWIRPQTRPNSLEKPACTR